MTDGAPEDGVKRAPASAGERLRAAREAQGLTLNDVAGRTRVPVRHLAAIEGSDYSGLPSPTYAIGFARAYARAVGIDEVAIAQDVRAQQELVERPPEYVPYEMADPRRVPSRGLAIAGLVVAVLIVIGVIIYLGNSMRGGSDGASSGASAPVPTVSAPAPAPHVAPAGGPVVLTATDDVWLRVYDADNTTLMMRTLKPGESYTVPGDAKNPMINVGRPDKLQVTVGGRRLAPLGTGERAIKDVPVSAAALADRPLATDTATPAPVANASPQSRRVTPARSAAAPTRAARDETAAANVAQRGSEPSSDATATP